MTTPPPIYPSHCHGLSPTLGRWCPLLITDVFALTEVRGFEGQGIYFHLNHPIKWIRLTGIVVAIDEFYNRICYTIDDSSGATIEASCAAPPKPDAPPLDGVSRPPADNSGAASTDPMVSPDGPRLRGIDVGSVVKVKGGIAVFRDVRRVAMKAVAVLGDTGAEVRAWRERVRFREEVLRAPWVVTEEQEDRCRREAEGGRWREEKGRRERRRGEKEREGEKEGRERRREREKEKERGREREKEKEKERERKARARAMVKLVRLRAEGQGKYDALGL